ncbi:MAG: hypothetical protein SO314_04500, partial [Alphaproteobacteria bacterium]|nr:hypothetical protein [Alphaproteobacteria bacterium]
MKMLHMKLMLSATVLALMTNGKTFAREFVLSPAPFNQAALSGFDIPLNQQKMLALDLPAKSSGIQVAGICFLPDCNLYLLELDDINSDTKWCENNGYYFNCPDGTAADYSQTCYRDETYTKCTAEQWCKNKGYDKTFDYCRGLGDTWYADEDKKCPNGQPLYQECKEDFPRACEDDGKYNSCAVGRPSKNDSEICEWDSNYAECCTDTPSYDCPENSKVEGCEGGTVVGKDSCGYDCYQCCTTSCPSGYAYTDAQTSGGTTGYIKDGEDYCNHCTRGKLYKRKQNPCSGYSTCSTYG